jgi:transcriptional regulator with XRE-family HTH domain
MDNKTLTPAQRVWAYIQDVFGPTIPEITPQQFAKKSGMRAQTLIRWREGEIKEPGVKLLMQVAEHLPNHPTLTDLVKIAQGDTEEPAEPDATDDEKLRDAIMLHRALTAAQRAFLLTAAKLVQLDTGNKENSV